VYPSSAVADTHNRNCDSSIPPCHNCTSIEIEAADAS
jgi:hypothetical protein